MPELVLSTSTSFFFGGIQAAFRNAQKYGFKYLEIVPYRWTRPETILALEKTFGIAVAGIHLPGWWQKTLWQAFRDSPDILEKALVPLWYFSLGNASQNPGLALAEALEARRPYLLLHSNVVEEMRGAFPSFAKTYRVVVENIPVFRRSPSRRFYWDPLEIHRTIRDQGLTAGLVFDIGHLRQTRKLLPEINLLEMYQETRPEIIHISYNSNGIHTLPDKPEQIELIALLKIHQPKYIVLETNPLVNIKRGKELLEKIIEESQ